MSNKFVWQDGDIEIVEPKSSETKDVFTGPGSVPVRSRSRKDRALEMIERAKRAPIRKVRRDT